MWSRVSAGGGGKDVIVGINSFANEYLIFSTNYYYLSKNPTLYNCLLYYPWYQESALLFSELWYRKLLEISVLVTSLPSTVQYAIFQLGLFTFLALLWMDLEFLSGRIEDRKGWVIYHICIWKRKWFTWYKSRVRCVSFSSNPMPFHCIHTHHIYLGYFVQHWCSLCLFIFNESVHNLSSYHLQCIMLAALQVIASNSASCGRLGTFRSPYQLWMQGGLMGKFPLCALLGKSSAVGGRENGSRWRLPLK